MIDFIPTLKIRYKNWGWSLLLFPALVLIPYREVIVTAKTQETWMIRYWLFFGIGRRVVESK